MTDQPSPLSEILREQAEKWISKKRKSAKLSQGELVDIASKTDPAARLIGRRYNRIVKWCAQQSSADLRSHIAYLLTMVKIERDQRRAYLNQHAECMAYLVSQKRNPELREQMEKPPKDRAGGRS